MKRIITTILVGMAFVLTIQAALTSGSCGEHLQWSYNSETRAFVITGYGDMYDYDQTADRPWDVEGGYATSISLPDGLTHIGNNSFRSFNHVTKITIPTSVISIGIDAFMEFGRGEDALIAIEIPDNVETIGRGAFRWITKVSKVIIGKNVKSIDGDAFTDNAYYTNTPVYVNALLPPYISKGVFDDKAQIYVPCDAQETYANADVWKVMPLKYHYNNRIKALSTEGGTAQIDSIDCNYSNVYLRAIPANSTYRFVRWSDGVTDNPRTLVLTQDTTITAIFEEIPYYTISASCDKEKGVIYNGWYEFESGKYQANTKITLEAESADKYKYVFSHWSDGETDNPRTLVLTQDTTITAIFEDIPYRTVTLMGQSLSGNTYSERYGKQSFSYKSYYTFTIRSGRYINIQENGSCGEWLGWSDGETTNERQVTIVSDTTIYSLFDPTYHIDITADENGYLYSGDIHRVFYGCSSDSLSVCAYPDEGYYFTGWSDGNRALCRSVVYGEPYQDITLTAQFAPCRQVAVLVGVESACKDMGSVSGSGMYKTGDNVVITATPAAGYHFVEWSDGAGSMVRSLYLMSDTTLFATFAVGEYGGKCGDNLYWTWDNGILSITGTGDMDLTNYPAWEQYAIDIDSVSFPDCMTSISPKAFTGQHAMSGLAPSQTYLQSLQQANHFIVCIRFLDAVCNDIVWAGPYNNWSSELSSMLYFQRVPGYPEWYYVNAPLSDDILSGDEIGKPVQLDNDGAFSWEYQAGDPDSWSVVAGSVAARDGYVQESQLYNYVYSQGPLVLVSSYFKNTPCTNTTAAKGATTTRTSYSLKSVVIPATVSLIGADAFVGCPNLRHFEYQGNTLTIESSIWADNYMYMSYVRANTDALYGISYADTVSVSNGYVYVNNLPYSTYYDLRGASNWSLTLNNRNDLRVLYLPDSLEWIGNSAFMSDKHLGGVTIPEKVTFIGESAFEDCRSLDSVVFAGNLVQTIGDWAFYNCHSLRTLTLPEGIMTIGNGAFYGCTYLSELVLPSTVESIADNGFALCSKLCKITVAATTPPQIDAKTFEDVDRATPVYVPLGTRNDYANAPCWKEFFNITETSSTAIDNTTTGNKTDVCKVFRDGQIYILRGGKVYTLTGVEVE